MLSPSNGELFSVLYSFTFAGGYQFPGPGPWASLFRDSAGNLYGTTTSDGVYGYGNVFKLTPGDAGWTYTSLHDFTGGSDGGNPISNVIFHFEVEKLPGLNHLFQTAKTGAPSEYAEIKETMSPIALEKIANWVLKQ